MSSTKKDNVKESTTNQFKETSDRYLEQQRQQQYKDTASNISDTTKKIIIYLFIAYYMMIFLFSVHSYNYFVQDRCNIFV